jgi:hypothetical protein
MQAGCTKLGRQLLLPAGHSGSFSVISDCSFLIADFGAEIVQI